MVLGLRFDRKCIAFVGCVCFCFCIFGPSFPVCVSSVCVVAVVFYSRCIFRYLLFYRVAYGVVPLVCVELLLLCGTKLVKPLKKTSLSMLSSTTVRDL